MVDVKTHLQGFGFMRHGTELALIDKPLRTLVLGEVLLENKAIGLNPIDCKLLELLREEKNAQILGVDGIGKVIESTSTKHHRGEHYAYHASMHFDGSFSTHIYLPHRTLLPIPTSFNEQDFFQASAIICPGLTAMQCVTKAPSIKGQEVLIIGAGGSVGRILSVLCVRLGARVWAVCDSKHHEALKHAGVRRCLEYVDFHHKNGLPGELISAFYAVFDCLGWRDKLVPLLRLYGHFIGVAGRLENPTPAFDRYISLHEISLGAIHSYGSEQDFALLQAQWKFLLKTIYNSERHTWHAALPALDIIDFPQIPKTLKRLASENIGRKIIAKFPPPPPPRTQSRV